MLTTTNHTAAKLRRIELRKEIAELERKERFCEAVIGWTITLSIGAAAMGFAIMITL
jgi:hypothetical protein